MRRLAAVLALATLTLLGGLTYGAHDAAAITGTITLTVQCGGDPERTTITNNTDAALDLAQFTITSLVSARQGAERLPLSGILAPGTAKTFESGSAAANNVVTRQSIYVGTDPNEGARLATPYGPIEVLCSVGSRSLAVTDLVPTATVTMTSTAGATSAPTAVATTARTATALPTMPTTTATATRPALATATRPATTRTPVPQPTPTATATMTPTAVPTSAPTAVATTAPTATATAVMAGLPGTGGGGGRSQPFGALGALGVLLIAIMAASGLVARVVTRQR